MNTDKELMCITWKKKWVGWQGDDLYLYYELNVVGAELHIVPLALYLLSLSLRRLQLCKDNSWYLQAIEYDLFAA